jgi:transporter family-2 protein
MTHPLFVVAIAVAAGLAVALQAQFMGSLERAVGTSSGVFITYGVGSLVALAIWVGRGASLEGARRIPWYAWSAGALGLVIVGGIGYAAPRIGLSRTLIITVAAQIIAALLIDHFGLLGATQRTLDAGRLLGVVLTVAGVWLVVRQ